MSNSESFEARLNAVEDVLRGGYAWVQAMERYLRNEIAKRDALSAVTRAQRDSANARVRELDARIQGLRAPTALDLLNCSVQNQAAAWQCHADNGDALRCLKGRIQEADDYRPEH